MTLGADRPEPPGRAVLHEPEGVVSAGQARVQSLSLSEGALYAANRALVRQNANLSQLNNEFRTLLESAALPMLSLDRELRVRAFTPELLALFNLREADKGRPASDITHRLQACAPLVDAAAVLQSGLAVAREVRLGDTGQIFLMRIHPSGQAGGAGEGVVLSFLDITVQKRAEEQVGHAGKLIALGEMASGMAHELNQPLNTIRIGLANITARLRQSEVPPDDVLARIERVERNVERAIGVVSHILAFGRREQEAPGPFEALVAVRDACLLAQQELQDAGISLTISEGPGRPLISGHASLLEQVVLNLLLNARDAIQSRRELEPALQGRIEVTLEASATALVLRVRDNGIGIAPDTAARLFEPFFTTKDIGKGTGLGLSISARIIGEMGGRIGVEAVAEGACFRMDLPVAKGLPPA